MNVADTQIIWEVLCQTCSWIAPGPARTLISGSGFCAKCSLRYVPLQRIFQLCRTWYIMWHRTAAFWKSLINREFLGSLSWSEWERPQSCPLTLPTSSAFHCSGAARRRHQGSHLDGNQWYIFLCGLEQLSLWSSKCWSWLKGVCGDCGSLKPGLVQSLCT